MPSQVPTMLAIDTDIDTHRPIGYLFRIGLADMYDQPGAATITFVLNVPGFGIIENSYLCAFLLMLTVILFEDDILLVRDG